MKASKTYQKWEKRVNDLSTPWTEDEIIYFRKATGASGLKARNERVALQALFRDTIGHDGFPGYRITRNHDVKGQAYIITKSERKDGNLRAGAKFTKAQLKVFKELEYHLLVGMYFPQYGLDYWLPVYRAVSPSGYVEYVGATYELVRVLATDV